MYLPPPTSARTPPPGGATMAGARSALWSAGMTLLVLLLGLAFIGLNTAIAYLTVGLPTFIPIGTGVVFCLAFGIALQLLHRAWWLALLSIVPALFVLVGSVQLAPEAVLEQRGVRHEVTIVDVEVNGKRHAFTLRGPAGPLDEPLIYQGSSPGYRVGGSLTVLTDPKGEVTLQDATKVDAAGKRSMLLFGAVGWVLCTPIAGWRGHVRRKKGKYAITI